MLFSVVRTHIFTTLWFITLVKTLWAHSGAVMTHTVVDKSTDNAKPHSICQISMTLKQSDDDDIDGNSDDFDYYMTKTN